MTQEDGVHFGGNWYSDARSCWMWHWEHWRRGKLIADGDSVSERGARQQVRRHLRKLRGTR